MLLGHNFDKVAGLNASSARGIELMKGGTWLVLRRYLEEAEVDAGNCFFTNIFVGLQPHKSVGKMVAPEEYKKQCRDFLHKQITITEPRLVAILGIPAAEQYSLSGCATPHVNLDHPLYAFSKGRFSEECASIVSRNATKLRSALDELAVEGHNTGTVDSH